MDCNVTRHSWKKKGQLQRSSTMGSKCVHFCPYQGVPRPARGFELQTLNPERGSVFISLVLTTNWSSFKADPRTSPQPCF